MIQTSKKMIGVLMVALLVLGMASAAFADPVTVSGTIIETDDNYLLDTGDKKFILDGEVDEDMVNQDVSVTGELGTDDGGNEVLTIESIEAH
jgi:hypothetical protein